MADKDEEETGILKYRFVEEFPESIDSETGKPYEDIDSPKKIETELWGEVEFHRIAKIKWTETVITRTYTVTDTKGNVKEEEIREKVYEEEMGEIGGWIEKKRNLDQNGDCWVKDGAFVLGDAHVMDDAIIEKGVEVGDFAKVGGEAKLSGEFGVGEEAVVIGKAKIGGGKEILKTDYGEKWKKGMSRKRMAVGGHAVVRGEVLGTSKVYGNAEVGEHAKLSGEAKVYGFAYVNGTKEKPANVSGEAVVHDHARVGGTVKDKAAVFGTAYIGPGGVVGDTVYLDVGTIYGELKGNFHFYGMYFYLGEKSTIECLKEDEKGKVSFPDDLENVGNIYRGGTSGILNALHVGKNCYLKHCAFGGLVRIEETDAIYSRFENSLVKDCYLYDSVVSKSIIQGAEAYHSTIERAQGQDGFEIQKTSVKDGIIPQGIYWEGVSFSGVTDVKEAFGVMMESVTKDDMDRVPMDLPYEDPDYQNDLYLGSGGNPIVTYWGKYSYRHPRSNVSELKAAKVTALIEADNYDAGEDPPIYAPPVEGRLSYHVVEHVSKGAVKTPGFDTYIPEEDAWTNVPLEKYRYDRKYREKLYNWWLANTENGKYVKKQLERQQVRNATFSPVERQIAILHNQTGEFARDQEWALSKALGFENQCGLRLYQNVEDAIWKEELRLCKKAFNDTSTSVVITAPYRMLFVSDPTHYDETVFIPDFKSQVRIPAWNGDTKYIQGYEDGIYVSESEYGEWLYDEYENYSTFGGMNTLVYWIEYMQSFSLHPNKKNFTTVDYSDIENAHIQAQEKFEKEWEELLDRYEVDYYHWTTDKTKIREYRDRAFLPGDVEYKFKKRVQEEQEAYVDAFNKRLKVEEEKKAEEERNKKQEEYYQNYLVYQKRWDKIKEKRKYVSDRNDAILEVKHFLWSITYNPSDMGAMSAAKKIRDILQTLMYGSPSSEDLKILVNDAKKNYEPYK